MTKLEALKDLAAKVEAGEFDADHENDAIVIVDSGRDQFKASAKVRDLICNLNTAEAKLRDIAKICRNHDLYTSKTLATIILARINRKE